MPAAGSQVANAQSGNAAQPLNLAPQLRLGPRVQYVEPKFGQLLQISPRLQLIQNRERIEFPHGGFGPRPFEGQMVLPTLPLKGKVQKMKVVLQPLQKRWLKNSAPPIKRVTCQPD